MARLAMIYSEKTDSAIKVLNLAMDLTRLWLRVATSINLAVWNAKYRRNILFSAIITKSESIKIPFLFEFTNCIKHLFIHRPFPFSINWIDNTSRYKCHNIFFNCTISMINVIFLEIDPSAFQWFKLNDQWDPK